MKSPKLMPVALVLLAPVALAPVARPLCVVAALLVPLGPESA